MFIHKFSFKTNQTKQKTAKIPLKIAITDQLILLYSFLFVSFLLCFVRNKLILNLCWWSLHVFLRPHKSFSTSWKSKTIYCFVQMILWFSNSIWRLSLRDRETSILMRAWQVELLRNILSWNIVDSSNRRRTWPWSHSFPNRKPINNLKQRKYFFLIKIFAFILVFFILHFEHFS
jgi:hypothetical protein